MQLDINIEGIVAESVAAALSPEKLQPIIQSNVEDTVKRAIESQFSYRSKFKEMLEEKLAGVMPTDVKDIGRFGDLVVKTVSGMLSDMQNQVVKQSIQDRLAEMMKPLPQSITLTELLNSITKGLGESDESRGEDRPTIIIETTEGVCAGYWHLYVDAEERTSKYSCAIQMDFDKEGKCYSLKINDYDPSKTLFLGSKYGLEALLLNLYTGGVKVQHQEVDIYDFYYGNDD
ncbi:hypothetical protein [Pseudomonas donghuensis]|uniref:hypothetical protein n=1 Tax=Pseudomonas donghuensis TaxID=1163398 RepID=UPI00029A2288|nr:hypothetical protein [Pseudomonas donghuensis]